jgi:hypothetical protein
MKTRHSFWNYMLAILMTFFLLFAYDTLTAKEFIPNAGIEISTLRSLIDQELITPQQREYYLDKIDFHESNAKRTYEDAKNRCWWLPEISERDKARYCITTAGALAQPGTPQSKIIKALVNLLIQYGIDCMDEWAYIQNKLYWSQYHWEMYEFYCEVLVNG